MANEYRAVINLDYTGQDANAYTRILKALEAAGWVYVETSAMAFDGDLDGIRIALEILAKTLATPGLLSALTVQVQLMGPPRDAPGPWNPDRAIEWALGEANPSASS